MAGYTGPVNAGITAQAQSKEVFAVTTSTTAFSFAHDLLSLQVFHNGIRLVQNTDYSANGVVVTLTNAAINGDQVVLISNPSFQVADAYTRTEADAAFLKPASSLNAAKLTGNIAAAQLTGALPAISGAALTSLTSANLTGALPAIDGSALTGLGGGTPAGAVIYHAANAPPTGFIKANGAAISRSTYADLFSAIGTTFGAGDGSTTFLVPDLRGEFMRGWDDSRGVDNGRAFGSAQASQFGAHNHLSGTTTHDSHSRAYGGVAASGVGSGGNINYAQNQAYTSTVGGTGNSSETRSRNVALLACIKY